MTRPAKPLATNGLQDSSDKIMSHCNCEDECQSFIAFFMLQRCDYVSELKKNRKRDEREREREREREQERESKGERERELEQEREEDTVFWTVLF